MKLKRFLIPILLILVGEGIFILPFLVTRLFRPTFLTVFDISNFELGSAFSVYGIVAAISYFFGGPIADKFSPKILIGNSLIATALAGILMTYIPSITTLTILYGFWGLTTILLFWAAFIKSVRLFWSEQEQGKAYGTIDAGRGIFAALLASASIALLDYLLPSQPENASIDELTIALSSIILLFSLVTFICGVLVLSFLPNNTTERLEKDKITLEGIKNIAQKRSIWLNAIIVLCAYVGYKCTDDFSLYAADVLNYNDVDAAHVGSISFWIRPFAALGAGLLGDRFLHSNVIRFFFLIILFSSLFVFSGLGDSNIALIVVLTLTSTSLGVYGLRGLYFATISEAKIPLLFTGSAVGLISVIGYTPDIFFGPLMGHVLDTYPGELGHQYLFGILALFSLIGIVASTLFKKKTSA